MTRKQLLAQLRRERKSDILLQGDKFEEKAFIEGKVKLITTNGTKGNQNNWQAVGCDWTCTKKDWFHWVDKACERGSRGLSSVCVNCESRGERERDGERRQQFWGCCFRQGAWRRERGSLASWHQDPQDSTLHSPFSGYYSFSSLYVFFFSIIIS